MAPDPQVLSAAVRDALAGLTVAGANPAAYLVDVPGGPPPIYYVVTPSPGGFLDGPLARPDDDGELIVLVTSVAQRFPDGQGAAQCQHLQQAARTRLLGADTVDVDGLAVNRLRLDVPGGVALDRDPNPPRFFAVDRFAALLTPA